MKKLTMCVCLVTTVVLGRPSAGQEATPQNETGAQAASDTKQAGEKESAADKEAADKDAADKEKVPEKIVSEKEAIKQLVGDYRIVSGEKSGEQILPERLADVTVRFTEKTITTYDGQRNARFSATFRIDTQQRPWRLRMMSVQPAAGAAAPESGAGVSPASSQSDGLVELANERVKVIYALPGGTAPRAFQTGDRQQMFELEKLPDPVEKANDAVKANGAEEAKDAEKPSDSEDNGASGAR